MRSTRYVPRHRSRLAAPAAAAVGVMLLTSCGGGSADTGSDAKSAGGTKIIVDESEFALKVSPMTLKAGAYTFVAKNAGQVTHALEVEGPGVEDKRTKDISTGQSAALSVTLKTGSYTLYCPVDGHEDKGMKLTLTVT